MQLKSIKKAAAALLAALSVGSFSAAGYYSGKLPGGVISTEGRTVRFAEYPEISCSASNNDRGEVTASIFGTIPVKSISVTETSAKKYAAGGIPFGIKLLMEGVMVTGLGSIKCSDGSQCCPAKDAGIESGDIICLANGNELTSNGQLQKIISGSGGKPVELTVRRGESEFTTTLTPVFSCASGAWRGGMWVRDSLAGIGTMTMIDTETGNFAGLGHPICDADTGELVPVHSGEAVPVEITEAKRGEKGIPGELHGRFRKGTELGSLTLNTNCGIFGKLTPAALKSLSEEAEIYELAHRQEIKTGSAEIIASVSGNTPQHYSAEIERIDLSDESGTKNMVIRITDSRLIDITGGIIQGMSGSPVIQDGKLVGAVTHVFVADPTRGYAIFAENMASSLDDIR